VEVVDLLSERVANGVQFAVTNTVESGDQVAVTLSITGPQIPGSVTVTKFFTFAPGTNTVIRMNDGVDVLALRALAEDYELD
jgi:hypothetical protein